MKKPFDFRERYSELDDETLAFTLLGGNLVPEAEQALKEELSDRGIDDVSTFRDPLVEQDWQRYREETKALRAMPLWRRISVLLSCFVVIGIAGQGILLPRYYVYEHYGPIVAVLDVVFFVISVWWMLAHIPRPPKE